MADHVRLCDALRALRADPPSAGLQRAELLRELRLTANALETPPNRLRRLIFSPMNLIVGKILVDLKVFDVLGAAKAPVSLEDLAARCGCQRALLRRLLRFMCAEDMVEEEPPGHYALHEHGSQMSHQGFQGAFTTHFEMQLPVWSAMPAHLALIDYTNPEDHEQTCFRSAMKTELDPFQWLAASPDKGRSFNLWMAAQHNGAPSWLDVFPVERFTDECRNPDRCLFVDVGGGIGHECAALRMKVPATERRLVVQDLPHVISQAPRTDGIEYTACSFWDGQPEIGASFYFLRNVLHDFPDEKVIELLKLQREAMREGSVVLIDELVVPEVGGHLLSAAQDFLLMSFLGAAERTRSQWNALFDAAGLELKEEFKYSYELGSTLMVLTKF